MLRRGFTNLNELKKDNRKEAERKERTRCERESAVSVKGSSMPQASDIPNQLSASLSDSLWETLGSSGKIAELSTSTFLGVQWVPICF